MDGMTLVSQHKDGFFTLGIHNLSKRNVTTQVVHK